MRLVTLLFLIACSGEDEGKQQAGPGDVVVDSGSPDVASDDETGAPPEPPDPAEVTLDSIHLDRTRLDLETGPEETESHRFVLTGLWSDGSTERLLLEVVVRLGQAT